MGIVHNLKYDEMYFLAAGGFIFDPVVICRRVFN